VAPFSRHGVGSQYLSIIGDKELMRMLDIGLLQCDNQLT